MKILSIVGARPQFIKLAPLCKNLDEKRGTLNEKIDHLILHTGQHFDKEMSELFFEQLEIPVPEYNLEVSGGTQAYQTGNMLVKIEEVLQKESPDLVIVFGDTNSTIAGSLAAAKLKIKTIHIEAGLRSFNRTMPEEINRIVSDHASDYLFAPTSTAVNNLIKEGLGDRTFLLGDIMVDSLTDNIAKANKFSDILSKLNIKPAEFYLVTLHRPYTVDDPNNLKLLLHKLSRLGKQVIFPVHPRTKKIIEDNRIYISDTIKIIKPVGYLDFIKLEQSAEKILTDSGGIQKEAYILKRPCVTVRPETEWVETVDEGWNILRLPSDENFIESILSFNPDKAQSNIFGSNVSEKMVNKIFELLHI